MNGSFSSSSDIKGYPKNLTTLNTIKKSDTFYELPVASAQVLLKNGKLPKNMKKKLKELQESSSGNVYITYEGMTFDLSKLEFED